MTRKTIRLTEWDGAKYLKTREDVALYLYACFAEGDSPVGFIAQVLDDIARSEGLAQLALEIGIDGGELARRCSQQNPSSFAALLTLLKALGLQFRLPSL